ncbi:MAG: carboxypeptidase-like regulatory domain-containing protein, partial [Candidatus Marinimicrobia bacterium]|nr:carboxypeptidase-like regulatory domain-containing protein [Candidatus Neomarinimicrobiota bacterium]
MKLRSPFFILFTILGLSLVLYAGTTGKIAGYITDAVTGAPLTGVNVVLMETNVGAATDLNGYYVILNIPPGKYNLKISMIGYREILLNDVPVHTDFTTSEDFQLQQTVLEGQGEVIVMGRRPDIQRDRTSTMSVIGSDEISKMPVTEFQELINLQAGVVNGHFRGGRQGEVLYMMDGISVSDPYNGSMAIEVENSSIQEVKVISGTFSAEYGQAMSGVVNIITRTGTEHFSTNANFFSGDYVSRHDPPFLNIREFNPAGIRSGELTLTGPLVIIPKAYFFISARKLISDGYLYGRSEFQPSDLSNIDDSNPENWTIQRSGNGKSQAMNPNEKISLNGKLSLKMFSALNLELQGSYSNRNWKDYNHLFKYNPDGIINQYQDRYQFSTSLTHIASQSTFYTFKFNQFYNNYESYVHDNPFDAGYVSPQLLRRLGFGFYTGGMDMSHFYRNTRVN